jgi:hypothetical protein
MISMKRTTLFIFLVVLSCVASSPLPNESEETEDVTEFVSTNVESDPPTENKETSTDKIDINVSTEQIETRENASDEILLDESAKDNSTESRSNIRDFYRRRRQKHVESLQVDTRPRVAKNQTASDILMQKIRLAKEQQKNYFDPASDTDNSVGQKRKRLVRVRPKFNELSAAATSPTIVTVPPPPTSSSLLPSITTNTSSSSSKIIPPLIAATNTLLMWNENKTVDFPPQGSHPNDWSRKKASGSSSIISSRLKNFRERKKNGSAVAEEVSTKSDAILPTTPGKI